MEKIQNEMETPLECKDLRSPAPRNNAGVSQNLGPILVPLSIRCRNIIDIQKGPRNLGTTHVPIPKPMSLFACIWWEDLAERLQLAGAREQGRAVLQFKVEGVALLSIN